MTGTTPSNVNLKSTLEMLMGIASVTMDAVLVITKHQHALALLSANNPEAKRATQEGIDGLNAILKTVQDLKLKMQEASGGN